MTDLERRVAELEEQLRTGRLDLKQLPLTALKNKLTAELRPDGDTFLLPKSVGRDSLEDDLIVSVTSLPTAPTHGQLVRYIADAANGIEWLLVYNASSASAHKWEFIGGSPLFAEVLTSQTTISTSYADLATSGPTVTVPRAGDYLVAIGYEGSNNTAGAVTLMSYAVGAAAASETDRALGGSGTANLNVQAYRERVKAGLAAATALTAKYRVGSGTGTFLNRWMSAVPIRVS